MWSAARDERALGLACYDAHFPGAAPFAAASPRAAHALLAALQPRAASELTLVVHDDLELVRALLEAAARKVFETVHYRGLLSANPAGL
ncbi:MAG TPA: hypothetical protein VJR89_15235 [Polyangiales bacterium]|nr:hypothetical protein [Polyangiales bacterium]